MVNLFHFISNKKHFLFVAFLFLFSCKEEQKVKVKTGSISDFKRVRNISSYVIVNTKSLYRKCTSIGKIKPLNEFFLPFQDFGIIKSIHVTNSSIVKKGTLLASLDDIDNTLDVEEKKAFLESKLDLLNTEVIKYGLYEQPSFDSTLYEKLKVRTGVNLAELNLKMSLSRLQKKKIIAPCDGYISDITTHEGEFTTMNNKFCTVSDLSKLYVDTKLPAYEYKNVQEGQKAEVRVLSDDEIYNAKVIQVDKRVDEQGLIDVRLIITDSNTSLLSNIDVKINIFIQLTEAIVVPVEALSKRNNRDVIFTYVNEKAKWTDVVKGPTNGEEVAINTGLNEGDTVLVSNVNSLFEGENVIIE